MKRIWIFLLLSATCSLAFGAGGEWKPLRGKYTIASAPLSDSLPDGPPVLADHADLEAQHLRALPERAKQLAAALENDAPKLIETLDGLVQQITVTTEMLTIDLNPDFLGLTMPIRIAKTVAFKRCGFGIRMLIPGERSAPSQRVDERLVTLIRRGREWFYRLVREGKGPTILAQEEGCSEELVRQMIYLGFLAPDLQKRIEAGEQPVSLTSKSLYRALPLPQDWEEQRRILGFT